MNIQSLLNPSLAAHASNSKNSPDLSTMPLVNMPRSTPRSGTPVAPTSTKKEKIPKDAPIYIRGKPKGEVRFPAFEYEDDHALVAELRKYQVYPLGQIGQHVRHIPYNSEKKDFQAKTGRDGFEAFQYSFRLPGESREHHAMWDYNVGLVRMTAWFKCLKYPKTTPARALTLNPGLRDISYSITGGALAAQGYWMPFAAAKAVAATFCWEIRHLLVPMFGKDFLDICVSPSDSRFADFKIDNAIVQACTEETHSWLHSKTTSLPPQLTHTRDDGIVHTPRSTPSGSGTGTVNSATASPLHEYTPTWSSRVLRPRALVTPEIDSDYYTESEDGGRLYRYSPEISPTSHGPSDLWSNMNRRTLRSSNICQNSDINPTRSTVPDSSSMRTNIINGTTSSTQSNTHKRAHKEIDDMEGVEVWDVTAGDYKPQRPVLLESVSSNPGGPSAYVTPMQSSKAQIKQGEICRTEEDVNAAYLLMELGKAESPAKKTRTVSV